MKKIILVLLVVLFGASLVGCIDSNITYGKVYNCSSALYFNSSCQIISADYAHYFNTSHYFI